MEEEEKGCVYFFRHIGLKPVKIGYSTKKSPIKRFEQFKTYAPYGAEILGCVVCYDPLVTEKEIHQKYKKNRLNGEWFDLTEIEVKNIIEHEEKITNYWDNYYKK